MKTVTLLLLLIMGSAAQAQSCTTTLSVGANIAQAVASAANGSTICLNDGNYGTVNLTNISRSGFVTLRALNPLGAQIAFGEIWNTHRVVISGFVLVSTAVRGCSTRIELRDSAMVANGNGVLFNYDSACPAGDQELVVDNVTFDRAKQALFEGRLSLRGINGIDIRNSVFSGQPSSNQSDGIFIGGNSQNVTIGPGNVFRDILQSQCGSVHCDAIQAYGGGANTIIDGNYFLNSSVYVGFYDGGSPSMTIRNNVFDTNPGGQAIQIGGINGMLMEHNTFRNMTLGIGTKFANTPHTNWTVQNNIFDNAHFTASGDQPGCGSNCIMRYNLKSRGGSTNPAGTNVVTGTAVWAGAGSPSNWAGWELASGSPGKDAGNDGKDMGTLYYGTASPQPPPATVPNSPTNVVTSSP